MSTCVKTALRRRRQSAQRGFTLIEVMISGSILLIGLAGMITALTANLHLQEHSRHMTAAIHIGEGVMEELVLLYPTDADLSAGAHGPRYFSRTGTELSSTPAPYQVNWTVTEGDPIAGIRRIGVTVSWTESIGDRSVSFATWRK